MNSVANRGAWNSLEPCPSQVLLDALVVFGYSQMTPVQQAAVPLFLSYKDVVVEAVTGSGKTLAFVIPIIEILLRRYKDNAALSTHEIGAIIISPTRELATQIHQVTKMFLDYLTENKSIELVSMLCIGGSKANDLDIYNREGCNILIGTPGKLDELFSKNVFNTKELEVLVMDEADRLLDMGFEQQVTGIIRKIPKQRRTGLFSATMTEAVGRLVRAGLRNPVSIQIKVETNDGKVVKEQKIPSTLEIEVLICDYDEKTSQLFEFLNKGLKTIVYFSTGACVDYFYKVFQNCMFTKRKIYSLHGKMDQKRRDIVYEKFKTEESVLFCTDVAARGLDLPDIDMVIQFDPPQDQKTFAHRCGRAARMGRKGTAIVFITPNEDTYIEFLKVRQFPVKQVDKVGEVKSSPLTINEYLQQSSTKDRDIYEKSIKAFVSWIRSYKEHEASFIFQLKQVNLGKVATAMGILVLPKMPELRNLKIDFKPVVIDTDSIPYKDKNREKQRKAKPKLKTFKAKSIPWSIQKEKKERKQQKKAKLAKKRLIKN